MGEDKWVERLRYSGFASEEEAKKFLDEGLRWFEQMEAEMRRFHEHMLRFVEQAFKPLTYAPTWTQPEEAKPRPTLEELIKRLEKLEKEIKETKEEIFKAYAQQKAKVELR
jgi:polyhydroxyalkanoate synthesis regulator phasin